MRTGSCRTSAVEVAVAQALDEVVGGVEADEPHLARPPVVLEHAHHREADRLVRAEDAVDRQAAVGRLERAQERFPLLVRPLDVGAAVLIRADDLDAGLSLQGGQESFLAPRGAVVPFGVAEEHDAALAVQQLGHVLAGQPAAGVVVGGDEADVVVALQARVENHDGDAALHRGRDRADERRLVERRERDAGDAARDGVLHLGHLRLAVVLAQRTAPHDLDVQLLRGFLRARVDHLPELVRGALGNHRHRQASGQAPGPAGTGATEQQGDGHDGQDDLFHRDCFHLDLEGRFCIDLSTDSRDPGRGACRLGYVDVRPDAGARLVPFADPAAGIR